MKNFLLALLAIILLIPVSCREAGEFSSERDSGGGQFGFTVVKDQNFPETFVGDETNINFKVVPNYDFATIKTYFKFGNSLSGTLKLNDQIVTPNQQYEFTATDNVFSYIGDEQGDHTLQFEVFNEKGISQQHTISMNLRNPKISFDGIPTANIIFAHQIVPPSGGVPGGLKIYQKHLNRNFKLKSEGTSSITYVTYNVSYEITAPGNSSIPVNKQYTHSVPPNTNQIEITSDYGTNNELVGMVYGWNYAIANKKVIIEANNNFGESVTYEVNP